MGKGQQFLWNGKGGGVADNFMQAKRKDEKIKDAMYHIQMYFHVQI